MKKTLSIMILAGLLTAGLASCVVDGNDTDGTLPAGTEPNYQITTGAQETDPIVIPTNDPAQVTYTPADDTVYVAATSASIKQVADVTKSENIPQLTELHRVGTSANWCKVEYNGQQYYIATKVLTTDDLGEKTFTACDKTMYTSGSVNLRKYASSDNDFSSILVTPAGGTEVKVIAESPKGWSKVECTVNSKSYKGFMSTQHLSTDPNGDDKEYMKNFTELDTPITMYVSTSFSNVRQQPYSGENGGTIVDVLSQGDKVTVVATGLVGGDRWSIIAWKDGSVTRGYFVATSTLRDKPYGSKATLQEMLAAYPDLTAFGEEKTLWIYGKEETDRVNGRDTPDTLDGSNVVTSLKKADPVTVVAYGLLEGKVSENETKAMEWALVKDAEKGFFFVAFDRLTTNSNGSYAKPALSLDELVDMYDFEKTASTISMKAKAKTALYGVPEGEKSIDVEADTVLTVLAQGETGEMGIKNKWYLVQYQDAYYFVIQDDLKLA